MNSYVDYSTVSKPRQVLKRILTGQNLFLLKKHFQINPYPSETETKEIANQLNTELKRVKKWFYNQRRLAVKKGEHSDNLNRRGIRERRKFTSEQYLMLRKAYESNSGKIPDLKEIENLAVRLKENDLQRIKQWFYSKRCKMQNKQLTVTNSSLCKSTYLMFTYIGLIWQIQSIEQPT